jgi:hypothetical protein
MNTIKLKTIFGALTLCVLLMTSMTGFAKTNEAYQKNTTIKCGDKNVASVLLTQEGTIMFNEVECCKSDEQGCICSVLGTDCSDCKDVTRESLEEEAEVKTN